MFWNLWQKVRFYLKCSQALQNTCAIYLVLPGFAIARKWRNLSVILDSHHAIQSLKWRLKPHSDSTELTNNGNAMYIFSYSHTNFRKPDKDCVYMKYLGGSPVWNSLSWDKKRNSWDSKYLEDMRSHRLAWCGACHHGPADAVPQTQKNAWQGTSRQQEISTIKSYIYQHLCVLNINLAWHFYDEACVDFPETVQT